MNIWLLFCAGIFIGCFLGVFVLSLCVASKTQKPEIEKCLDESGVIDMKTWIKENII